MTEKPRITIEPPSGMVILAARHLDATEGPVQVDTIVDAGTRSAITTVLRYISEAYNATAAAAPDAATSASPRRPCPDPRCPEDCPECGAPIHDLTAPTEQTATPPEEPCGQQPGTLPHPPHKFMRGRRLYQCPGDATTAEVECVYDNGCGKPEGECAVQCKAVFDAVAFAAIKAASPTRDAEVERLRAETAENRLRLAHQARRAKEHQLDGIRRALCDAGFMQDDDPYSHADLEDVIRQAAPAESADQPTQAWADQAWGALARVRRAVHIADAEDATDWQRGYRACANRVTTELDNSEPATEWTPPPPGSTREQLPEPLLDLIRDRLPDYLSTACQTADTVACAACYPGSGVPRPQYDEIREHAERLHERCRLNHKFTGQLCGCGCHPTEEQS